MDSVREFVKNVEPVAKEHDQKSSDTLKAVGEELKEVLDSCDEIYVAGSRKIDIKLKSDIPEEKSGDIVNKLRNVIRKMRWTPLFRQESL